jgi:hypothetical protein
MKILPAISTLPNRVAEVEKKTDYYPYLTSTEQL